MALCFFAVIILAFFTGIAIGYILFEFYQQCYYTIFVNILNNTINL